MDYPSKIVFKPSAKQFAAYQFLTDNVTTEIGYGGAAAGGKSYLGTFWILSHCLTYPGVRYLMGRKELVNLKRTTLATFFKVCREHGIDPDADFRLNSQTNIITFNNTSEIVLADLAYSPADPEFQRLGSLELTGAFVDEAGETLYKAIDILTTRLGRAKNEQYNLKPKLLEAFNPDKGHVYSRYYKPFKSNTLPLYRRFVQALPSDNPHTTEDYLNQLRRADKVTRMRLLEGNFEYDDDPNSLMDYDAIIDLFTNVGEDGPPALVIDPARFGDDKSVFTVWRGLQAVEWRQEGQITTDQAALIARALERHHSVPRSRIVVDTTGVGGGLADQLPGCKQFVSSSSPLKEKDGENFLNLRAQCSFMLADAVNARRIGVALEDGTMREELIGELEQVKVRDPDKDQKRRIVPKEDIKAAIGRSPDKADCLMMRFLLELSPTAKKPITQFFSNFIPYAQRVRESSGVVSQPSHRRPDPDATHRR